MPVLTLSLPAAIGLLALFLTIGAVIVYFAIDRTKEQAVIAAASTSTPTITLTMTPTLTPSPVTPTLTHTPLPTATPETYTIAAGDTCSGIAGFFEVSVNSIVSLNGLSTACILTPGNTLLIPQPTPSATPPPTSTFSVAEQTEVACEKVDYVVQENDTLSDIARAYGVSMASIKEENGLASDTVYFGQPLVIPLCMRPTPQGPTATPTPPPPYPAPALLLPADGAPFTLSEETITLQWASVGTIRDNEAYAVTIEDVTEAMGRKLIAYVSETKFIVPASFRPTDRSPHIYRWSVVTVRQTGQTDEGDPIWDNAGNPSPQRVFTWSGSGSGTPQP